MSFIAGEEFQHIHRIQNTNIDGNVKALYDTFLKSYDLPPRKNCIFKKVFMPWQKSVVLAVDFQTSSWKNLKSTEQKELANCPTTKSNECRLLWPTLKTSKSQPGSWTEEGTSKTVRPPNLPQTTGTTNSERTSRGWRKSVSTEASGTTGASESKVNTLVPPADTEGLLASLKRSKPAFKFFFSWDLICFLFF